MKDRRKASLRGKRQEARGKWQGARMCQEVKGKGQGARSKSITGHVRAVHPDVANAKPVDGPHPAVGTLGARERQMDGRGVFLSHDGSDGGEGGREEGNTDEAGVQPKVVHPSLM